LKTPALRTNSSEQRLENELDRSHHSRAFDPTWFLSLRVTVVHSRVQSTVTIISRQSVLWGKRTQWCFSHRSRTGQKQCADFQRSIALQLLLFVSKATLQRVVSIASGVTCGHVGFDVGWLHHLTRWIAVARPVNRSVWRDSLEVGCKAWVSLQVCYRSS